MLLLQLGIPGKQPAITIYLPFLRKLEGWIDMKQHLQIAILALNSNEHITISAVSSSHSYCAIPNDFCIKKSFISLPLCNTLLPELL